MLPCGTWTYLNRAGKRDAIPSLINRLFAKPDQPSLHYGPSDHVKHVDAGSIFESQIIRFTMGTAFCYFVANVVTYGFNSWLYVALTAAGVDFRVAVQTGIAFNSVSMMKRSADAEWRWLEASSPGAIT